MKFAGTASFLLLSSCSIAAAAKAQSNPLGTTLRLLGDLTAQIIKDGEVGAKAYNEYVEWCDGASKNTGFAIGAATKEKAKLEAKIEELTSDISVAGSKIDGLASDISTAEAELKEATAIREKENSDFEASEKELMEALDALTRAVAAIEKEMSKNPAAFAQVATESMSSTVAALGVVLDSAALSSSNQKKLLELVQSQQNSEADDDEVGAPAAAAYKTHSTGIVDLLGDMKEKAENQLSDLRKAEVNAKHNYDMLEQSLQNKAGADKKDLEDEKAGKAAAEEEKATAEGGLEVTTKELASSREQLATCQSTCLQVAADHEATVAARKQELEVIAKARKILEETTSGAASQTYSLLQVASMTGSRIQSRRDLAGAEVVAAIKRLARDQHSAALAQLASRVAAVARYGTAHGDGPFTKIKGLIRDMISKLERSAESEATEKAYCDEQLAKTEFKQGELEDDVAKMTSKIDRAVSESAHLKSEIQELEAELAALAKEQAEMDRIRTETHADYSEAKADLDQGLYGVRKALAELRDYYNSNDDADIGAFMQQPTPPETHAKSAGAGGSIINLLEVVESDFATNLAKAEMEETDAQSEYEKVSQENAVTKAAKEADVKYKSQEAKSRDTTVVEYSADRESANSELSAVNEYYSKIKERCIAKPESYEVRQKRRAAEIKGLKEALTILQEETALVQRKRHSTSFRGSLAV